jgi:hypothetical protein
MSESLSIVKDSLANTKDSSQNPKDTPQNPKAAIVAAVLTAISTILVSFIGIVPQLRRGDAEEIKALKEEFALLRDKTISHVPPILLDKKLNVRGTVTTLDGRRSLNGVDVFLLPEGNNLLTAKTDDSGIFNLTGIPAGTYSIIIRDSTQGRSGKGLLDEAEEEVRFNLMGARVKYRIRQ